MNMYVDISSNYNRETRVHFINNSVSGVISNIYPLIYTIGTASTVIYMYGNTYTDYSSPNGIHFMTGAGTLAVQQEKYSDITDFGDAIYTVKLADNVTFTDVSITQVQGTGDFSDYILNINMNVGGIVNLHVHITDSEFGAQRGINLSGDVQKFTLNNCLFENITLGGRYSLISTGTFKTVEVQNVTFSTMKSRSEEYHSHYMLSLDTINLTSAADSIIDGITIQNSDIGFLHFQSIIGVTSNQVRFGISNIDYRD